MSITVRHALATLGVFALAANASAEVDEFAARELARESKCTSCHSTNKKKDGPPYSETAEKYRGQADAIDKLYKHLTSNPTIKVKGKEETHKSPKTESEAEIRNLIAWILSQ